MRYVLLLLLASCAHKPVGTDFSNSKCNGPEFESEVDAQWYHIRDFVKSYSKDQRNMLMNSLRNDLCHMRLKGDVI